MNRDSNGRWTPNSSPRHLLSTMMNRIAISKWKCRPRHFVMSIVAVCMLTFIVQFNVLHHSGLSFLSWGRSFNTTATPDELTITVWTRLDHLIPRDTEHCIVSQGRDHGRFKLSILGDSLIRLTFKTADGAVVDLDPYDRLVPGRWYFLAVTYNAHHGVVSLWSNGLQLYSVQRPVFQSPLAATEYGVTLGRCMPHESIHWQGDIAQASLWTRELTAGEMLLVMNDGIPAGSGLHNRYFSQSTNPSPATRTEYERIGMGGMAREPVRHLPGRPWDDIVDVVFSVADGSWPYVITACELLFSDANNLIQIDRIFLLETEMGALPTDSKIPNVLESTTVYTLPMTKNDAHTSYSQLERALQDDPRHDHAWTLFIGPYVSPAPHFLTELLKHKNTDYLGMTARVLYPSGRLRHAGYEFRRTPTLDGEVMLPAHRMRGVPLGYKPSLREGDTVWAIDGYCALIQRRAIVAAGLHAMLAPDYHWPDASLRMAAMFPIPGQEITKATAKTVPAERNDRVTHTPRFGYVPSSMVYYTPTPVMSELKQTSVMDPLLDSSRRRLFLSESPLVILPDVPKQLRVMWDMHCGGSMGLEAAYFMRELETKVDLRVHPPRYGPRCEHLDTIGALPASFRDSLERMRLRVFDKDQVVIYHRDYREYAEYLPNPSHTYNIGRYMNEVAGMHRQWVQHCQSLHEVWVPSKWHVDVFHSMGVSRSKLKVIPEAVDVWLLDPEIVLPWPLREKAQWTFLSVFKFEDRKGWRELAAAYFQEFTSADPVSLVIHSYLYNGEGDQWNATRLVSIVHEYLDGLGILPPPEKRPRFSFIGHFLSADEMRSLYASADCYVQSSYGEGWGLPYHEAMSMGLPVIATRWSGQTEFLNDDVAYMVDIDGLAESPLSDPWFGGMPWAIPSVNQLRQHMRTVFTDQDGARARGKIGRQWVVDHYSMEKVSEHIANEFKRIETTVRFPLIPIPARPSSYTPVTEPADDISVIPEELQDVTERTVDTAGGWVSVSKDLELCTILPVDDTLDGSPSLIGSSGAHAPGRKKQIAECIAKPVSAAMKQSTAVDVRAKRLAQPSARTACVRIVMISSLPPRHCGIANFATSLLHGMVDGAGGHIRLEVIGMVDDLHLAHQLPSAPQDIDDEHSPPHSPFPLFRVIRKQDPIDYVRAAADINKNFDYVILQHEFGLFGGTMGSYIICLARMLRIPLITVAHTVHEFLNKDEHGALVRLFHASNRFVVMTALGKRYLHMFHNIPEDPKIAIIPHGVPTLERQTLADAKAQWQLTGRTVLLSTGLIHPGKGMHDVVYALPSVIKSNPNVTYVIAGEAHHSCGKPCSEYVAWIHRLIDEHKLHHHVIMIQRYLSTNELHSLIHAADIYIAAYTDPDVSSSGTVSVAMAARRVVMATPFIYAKEVLSHERGILVPFRDPYTIARELTAILRQPHRMMAMARAAMAYTRDMAWNNVGQAYLGLMDLLPSAPREPISSSSSPVPSVTTVDDRL